MSEAVVSRDPRDELLGCAGIEPGDGLSQAAADWTGANDREQARRFREAEAPRLRAGGPCPDSLALPVTRYADGAAWAGAIAYTRRLLGGDLTRPAGIAAEAREKFQSGPGECFLWERSQ